MLEFPSHLRLLANRVSDLQGKISLVNESEIEPYIHSLGELARVLHTLADKHHNKLSVGARVYDKRNNSTGVIYEIRDDKAFVGWDSKEQFVDCAANKFIGRVAGTACWTKLEYLELME